MGLKKWFASKLVDEKLIESTINERVKEAIDRRPFFKGDDTWRRLTDREDKDLTPIKQEKHQRIAYYLYMTNPLARRILEYTRVFTGGGEWKIKAEDESVEKALMSHWLDPVNLWPVKKTKKALELAMYGEQFYPVFVNVSTGMMRLGYIDPVTVEEVITNKDNPEVKEEVVVKSNTGDAKDTKKYKIINDMPTGLLKAEDNPCFAFSVNAVSNAARGYSDLLALEDWIDAYQKVVFNFVERSSFLQAFLWDIEIKGANEKEIQNRMEKLQENKPKAGSFVVHSDDETWTANTPDLRSRQNIEEARHIRNQFLAGAGYPEFWFAEGEMTTRATALAQGAPTLKVLEERQEFLKQMTSFILSVQLSQFKAAGTLKAEDLSFQLVMPDLVVYDINTVTQSVDQLSRAMTLDVDAGLLSSQTATELLSFVITKLGYEIDSTEELKKINEPISENLKRLEKLIKESKDLSCALR